MEPIAEDDIMDDPETGGRIAKGRVNTYPAKKCRLSEVPPSIKRAISDPEIAVTDYCLKHGKIRHWRGDYNAFAELLKL